MCKGLGKEEAENSRTFAFTGVEMCKELGRVELMAGDWAEPIRKVLLVQQRNLAFNV